MSCYFNFKSCTAQDDQPAIVNLLLKVKDELYLPDRQVAENITTLCFRQGGVIGAYDNRTLCGMMGYFFGEPDKDFMNKDFAFLYVGAILKPYRKTGMFHKGLLFSLYEMRKGGAKAIRLQAETTNRYTNKLYGRFATRLKEGKSMRGKSVITYGGSIEDALTYLERRKRLPVHAHNPTPHAFPG